MTQLVKPSIQYPAAWHDQEFDVEDQGDHFAKPPPFKEAIYIVQDDRYLIHDFQLEVRIRLIVRPCSGILTSSIVLARR